MSETADAASRAIAAAAHDAPFPDGRPGRFLTAAAVAALGRELSLPLRQVEIAALERGVCPLRYARNLHAFSLAEQARLVGGKKKRTKSIGALPRTPPGG